MSLDLNDPRLTAFALGELDESERGALETLLRDDLDAQKAVEEIRSMAQLLAEALHAEPAPELGTEKRRAIEDELCGPAVATVPIRPTLGRWVGYALAASGLIGFGLAGYMMYGGSLGRRDDLAVLHQPTKAARAAKPDATKEDLVAEAKSPAPQARFGDEGIEGIEAGRAKDRLWSERRDQFPPAPAAKTAAPAENKSAGYGRLKSTTGMPSGNATAPFKPGTAGAPTSFASGLGEGARALGGRAGGGDPASLARRAGMGVADARDGQKPADSPKAPPEVNFGVTTPPSGPANRNGQVQAESQARMRSMGRGGDSFNRPLSTGRGDAKPLAGEPGKDMGKGKEVLALGMERERAAADMDGAAPPAPGGGLQGGQDNLAFRKPARPQGTPAPSEPGAQGRRGMQPLDKKLAKGFDYSGAGGLPESKQYAESRKKSGADGEADRSKQITRVENLKSENARLGDLSQPQAAAVTAPSPAPAAPAVVPAPALTAGAAPAPAQTAGGAQANLGMLAAKEAEKKPELAQLQAPDRFNVLAEEVAPNEAYAPIVENDFIRTANEPLSTFSIDVDTGAYSNVRRFLMAENRVPPRDAVRLEEMVNYFSYDYPQPKDNAPFSCSVEVFRCPWNAEHRLARIGLKGRELVTRPKANLVFLVDVSGSMQESNKLPLVKAGLRMLCEQLGENDRVAIVVYAGREALAMPSTSGYRKHEIASTIDQLESSGSTNGAGGINLAYQVAADPKNFIPGGVNRIILCTDGDFNVGVTNVDALKTLAAAKAKESKVFLSVLGFGTGNLKDALMEGIADKGNGDYRYVDKLEEARKVFIEESGSNLVTIAKDVKIQMDFNAAKVGSYRLIGYENRALENKDFADDTKDAGEIGAGHTVTALYEIVPAGGKELAGRPAEASKYTRTGDPNSKESFTVWLRYKAPEGDVSTPIEFPVIDTGADLSAASADSKFAAAVASFGMLLRDSKYKGTFTYDAVLELAGSSLGPDKAGYRKEFLDLVKKAKELTSGPAPVPVAAPVP